MSGEPANPPAFVDMTIDGEPTFVVDAIEVDLHGTFDRSENVKADDIKRLALAVLQTVFARLRCYGRAFFMKFDARSVSWRLRYLSDTGEELQPEAGLVRGRGSSSVTVPAFMWIAPEQWVSLEAIATTSAPPSDELWLDALEALPHVGAAVVLAYTAIEVRIASALNILATNSPNIVGGEIWAWINDREQFLKEPSVEEQLTDLMQMMSGKSLKKEKQLWDGYCNLRKARNSFAHEGKAIQLDKTPVTPTRAQELIHSAGGIIDWIESALPEIHRTPRVATADRVMQRLVPLIPT